VGRGGSGADGSGIMRRLLDGRPSWCGSRRAGTSGPR